MLCFKLLAMHGSTDINFPIKQKLFLSDFAKCLQDRVLSK